MHSRAGGRLKLESDLRTALVERQFRIHYQPVLKLKTCRILSFEALLRGEHPAQGLISPYRFIEAAEDTGVLVSIGHWLMVQACRELREWEVNDRPGSPMNVMVNVSARQFADARLVNDIQDARRETGIDPSRLQLEKIASADPELPITVLSHLKHFGIATVLDDFGRGSTSLAGLTQFPIDALEIDRSLIHEMRSAGSAADIVELIVAVVWTGLLLLAALDAKAALIFVPQQIAAVRKSNAGT